MTTTLAFHPLTRWALWIELRLAGALVHAQPVTDADLEDLRLEAWWEARARRGAAGEARDDFEPRLAPVASDADRGADHGCAGLLLEADDPCGARVRCAATSAALDPVARRALRTWLAAGGDPEAALRDASVLLCATPCPRPPAAEADDGLTAAAASSTPLQVIERPLAPLLEGATRVGPAGDVAPLLFTRAAWEAAERASRRGRALVPPVESGALLLGYVGACPDTSEAYPVVTEVAPAAEDGTAFSLDIPPVTWAAARTRLTETPGLLVLGQAHGHNFLPQDVEGSECAACARPASCACDSAFLSGDDRTWSRAVFRGQPWQVGVVFGLAATGQPREAVFGQRGGRLVPRDRWLVDDFDPLLRS